MQERVYVGLDLGSSLCHQVVINSDGKLILSKPFKTTKENLVKAFSNLGEKVEVHIESGELSNWVRSLINPLVWRVVVSHPRTLSWIARDSVKSDKVDARKLAELLRINRVHELYYSDDEKRKCFKRLVVHYEELTRLQVKAKCKLKARLRLLGVIRKDSRVFTEEGRKEILSAIECESTKEMIEQLYSVLDHLIEVQTQAKSLMFELGKEFLEVKLLQTAPGVGEILACRFVGHIQQIERFSNKRKLFKYCRLGVTKRESNGKRLSHPRLDSSGNGSLKDVSRKVFEAAIRSSKRSNSFKRFYERCFEGTKNEVHARLSTMRKIISTFRAIWINKTAFKDDLF